MVPKLLSTALCGSLLITPTFVLAQTTAEELAVARQLGTEGVLLADAGKCQEAIPKLQKAADLFPAPTIVGRLGECQIALGKLVLGTETLQRVVSQDLGAKPNAVFLEAQKRAQRVLDRERPRIAKLSIRIAGAPVASVKVTVDDSPVPQTLLDVPRPTDPGTHTVTATAPGHVAVTRMVTLAEGGSSQVLLVFEPVIVPKPVAPETPAEPVRDEPPVASPSRGGTLTWISFGVGAVGMIGGGVFGLMASQRKSRLDDACPTHASCPPALASDIASMKTLAGLSTLGFVVGAVGLGAGAVLLFSTDRREAVARGPSARAWVGLGSLGVAGEF